MASPISICSQALLLLGDKTIASFTEPSDRATLAANLYPQQRKALMRAHPWNCLQRRVLLSPETATPAFEWANQFALPGDCIRVLYVGGCDAPVPYKVEGRRILFNGTALPLVYIADVDEGEWDDLLVNLMVERMAAQMAYPITKSGTVADGKRQDFADALKLAKTIDGQEDPPQELGDSPLLASRFGGGWVNQWDD